MRLEEGKAVSFQEVLAKSRSINFPRPFGALKGGFPDGEDSQVLCGPSSPQDIVPRKTEYAEPAGQISNGNGFLT